MAGRENISNGRRILACTDIWHSVRSGRGHGHGHGHGHGGGGVISMSLVFLPVAHL